MSTKMLNIFIITLMLTAAAVQARPKTFCEWSVSKGLRITNVTMIINQICAPKNCHISPIDNADSCWQNANVTDKSVCMRACVDQRLGILCICTDNTILDFESKCTVIEKQQELITQLSSDDQCEIRTLRCIIFLMLFSCVIFIFKKPFSLILDLLYNLLRHGHCNMDRVTTEICPENADPDIEWFVAHVKTPGTSLPRPIILTKKGTYVEKSYRSGAERDSNQSTLMSKPLQEEKLLN